MPKDLQTTFDVAVVMFTKRTGALASAVRSVFAQDFDGRVQVREIAGVHPVWPFGFEALPRRS